METYSCATAPRGRRQSRDKTLPDRRGSLSCTDPATRSRSRCNHAKAAARRRAHQRAECGATPARACSPNAAKCSFAGGAVAETKRPAVPVPARPHPTAALPGPLLTPTVPAPAATTICQGDKLTVHGGEQASKALAVTSNHLCSGNWNRKGDPPNLTLVSAPMHGTATVQGTNYSYRSHAGFKGQDAFKLLVQWQDNGHPRKAIVTYNVTVVQPHAPPPPRTALATPAPMPQPSVPAAPVAPRPHPTTALPAPAPTAPSPAPKPLCRGEPILVHHGEHTSRSLTASSNHACPGVWNKGPPVTLMLISPPRHGTVTVQGTTYTYKSHPGFKGSDVFTMAVHWQANGHARRATVDYNVTLVDPVLRRRSQRSLLRQFSQGGRQLPRISLAVTSRTGRTERWLALLREPKLELQPGLSAQRNPGCHAASVTRLRIRMTTDRAAD
jgi:hypothetical protein